MNYFVYWFAYADIIWYTIYPCSFAIFLFFPLAFALLFLPNSVADLALFPRGKYLI
jgi:hypothetical protein